MRLTVLRDSDYKILFQELNLVLHVSLLIIVSWACYFCSVLTRALDVMQNTRGVEIGEGTEKRQVPGRPAEVKMSEGLELGF